MLSARSYVVLALPCMGHLPNCVGGGFLINCAAVYQWAARRSEAGDGGRARAAAAKEKALKAAANKKNDPGDDDNEYYFDQSRRYDVWYRLVKVGAAARQSLPPPRPVKIFVSRASPTCSFITNRSTRTSSPCTSGRFCTCLPTS